jgi:hypothetical protein
MMTTEQKRKIAQAVIARRANFMGTDAKYATSLEINNAVYSQLKNGSIEKLLANDVWIRLARKMNISIGNQIAWQPAKTGVYNFVHDELRHCQQNHDSKILCDIAGIGKTFSAKCYTDQTPNAVFIDCSQFKTKQKFIRKIALEFGVTNTGRFDDVYEDLTYYLQVLENPLIVFDEVADLNADAFLEIKALWNAVNGSVPTCGFYMMGADGLKKKMTRRFNNQTPGYAEIFSRFGNKYYRVTPENETEQKEYKMVISAEIVSANFPSNTNKATVIAAADFEPRGLINERRKLSA